MPLVQLYRVRKAFKRSKRLKGRPEWQDIMPTTRQGRDAYKIADKYQRRFSRALLRATRGLLEGEELEREFRRAWKSGSIIEIMGVLPLFQEGFTDDTPVWAKFEEQMTTAYKAVIQAAGTDSMRDLNTALGTNLRFEVETKEPDGVVILSKAAGSVPVIPVNPYSVAWIKQHVLELVGEGISEAQRKVTQDILITGFEQGIRAEEALETLRANIGLTQREYKAVLNRRLKMEEAGISEGRIETSTREYTEQLTVARAQRIARTETIRANAQGRSDAWRVAIEEGSLPTTVVRKWLTPPPSPNPNRPCPICLDLDERTAPVGGVYESEFLGYVEGPPAHPNCRCTETLVREE